MSDVHVSLPSELPQEEECFYVLMLSGRLLHLLGKLSVKVKTRLIIKAILALPF